MFNRTTKKIRTYSLIVLLLMFHLLPYRVAVASEFQRDRNLELISEQLAEDNLIETNRAYISPTVPTEGKQLVEVIVELTEQPVVVEKFNTESAGTSFTLQRQLTAERKVGQGHDKLINHLFNFGIDAKVLHTYKTVFNGTTIQLPAEQILLLATLDNVKAIYPVVYYHSTATRTTDRTLDGRELIGAAELNGLGFTGEGVKVAVLDTGIDYDHPDLKDAYRGGFNFVDQNDDPYETIPNSAKTETTHGTHVSGIIAGQGNQENGMFGVAPDVELYAYRVLGPGGIGRSDWILAGIEKAVEEGIDIINLSLGNIFNDPDYPTAAALNNAMLAGTLAVVSAGNRGPDLWTVGAPGTSTLALTVGALHGEDDVWNFSSRGPVKKSLQLKPDIVAPGVSIRSTVAAYGGDYSNAYENFSGTSMASPYVAGVAALLKQAYPELSPFDLKALLMNNSKRVSEEQTNLVEQGAGRIQGMKAFHAPFYAQSYQTISFDFLGKLTETDYLSGSLSFGEVSLDQDYTLNRKIQLTSTVNERQRISVSTQFLNKETEGVAFNITQGEIEVAENEQVIIDLDLIIDHELALSGQYTGYVMITNELGHSVHLPFLLFLGEYEKAKGFEKITVNPMHYSKTKPKEITINIEVNSLMDEQRLLIWDGHNYIGQVFHFSGSSILQVGKHLLSWDGNYFDFISGKTKSINDGVYSLDFVGWDAITPSFNPYLVWTDFYVKSTVPNIQYGGEMTIEVEENTHIISGEVTDWFIANGQARNVVVESTYADERKEVEVSDSGAFSIEINNILSGVSELTIVAKDLAGNESEPLVVTFNNDKEIPAPEPGPEPAPTPIPPPMEAPPVLGDIGLIPVPPVQEDLDKEAPVVGEEIIPTIHDFKDYEDIQKLTWAAPSIENLVKLGVLQGYNGYYLPNKSMSREEFAKVIITILELHETTVVGDKAFTDVDINRWSAPFIFTAAQHGLIKGKTINGKLVFDPTAPITRAEVAVIISRAYNLTGNGDSKPQTQFVDVSGHWAEQEIAAVYQQKLLLGKSKTAFKPEDLTTRAEMAVILTRVLGRK